MTTGQGGPGQGGRPGVRANALPATSFARLRVIDARVSDALLDVLEDAGVAAYVEPSEGEVGVYRDVRSHGTPSDQLHVDAGMRDVAIAVISAELPGMLAELEVQPEIDDAAFEAIVAGFHESPEAEAIAWHESENRTAGATDDADNDDDWYPARAVEPVDDDDDHFVPPPPPPFPRLTARKFWGIVLLLGGFVLMAVLPRVGFQTEEAMFFGIATTVAGTAILVWSMRDEAPDDPDDGAVL